MTRFRKALRSPALAILLVAPFLGETLSTATPPLDLVQPWNLAILVALYGSGALICREVARRSGMGLLGLCLLAAAYAVYEEALVDRFWFDPAYADEVGVDDYGRVWHTSLLLATHLTAFHIAVSICGSIVLVERLFPGHRDRPWVGPRGLGFASVAMLLVLPVMLLTVTEVPAGPMVAAAALVVALVGAAFWSRDLRSEAPRRTPKAAGWIAFACTGAHFVLTYTVPATGLPWPVGVLVALAPIALGLFLLRRADDGLRVVTGVLAFFCLLDVLIGLFGRYDLTLGGLAAAAALWWLGRRSSETSLDMADTSRP